MSDGQWFSRSYAWEHIPDGYVVYLSTSFVVDEWPGMLTMALPVHMVKDMTDDEIESALFSEYVRASGDEAFDY